MGLHHAGHLEVSVSKLRNARAHADVPAAEGLLPDADDDSAVTGGNSERQRCTRNTVEAALSDIILLGTEKQVRMAAQAAQDMVAGRPVQTAALVSSLRQFIRAALYLEAIPPDVTIPNQGPLRPSSSTAAAGRRSGNAENSAGAGNRVGAQGSGTGGAGMGMGLGPGIRKDGGS